MWSGETWTFLQRHEGHASAVAFLEAVQASRRVSIQHADQPILDPGIEARQEWA